MNFKFNFLLDITFGFSFYCLYMGCVLLYLLKILIIFQNNSLSIIILISKSLIFYLFHMSTLFNDRMLFYLFIFSKEICLYYSKNYNKYIKLKVFYHKAKLQSGSLPILLLIMGIFILHCLYHILSILNLKIFYIIISVP